MKFLKPLVGLLALQKAAGLNHDTSSSDGRMDLQSPSNPLNVGGQEGVFSQIMTVDGAVALNDELDHSFYFAEAEKKRLLLYESTNAEDRKIYSEELLSLINKAIELNPEEKNQYHLRGQAYLHLGENDKALIDFQKEIEINPNYASYHEMGIIYTRTGDLEKADEFLSKAIKIKIFKGAYYNRGIVYEKMGYPRKALEDFNKELEINPSFQEAIHRKENNPSLPHFEHEEEFIAAKKYFEEFLKDKESGFDADNLVKVADRAIDSFYGHSYNKGIWDTRVSPIENVNKFATPLEKELIEEYLSFKEMVCDTLSKQEKDAEAISVRKKQAEASFADIVAIRPAALQERHDRGRKYFREDRKQDALDDFDKIILLEPQKTWVNYDRATVLYSNGDNHGAIESFTKEIDLNRDSLSHAY
jgi:tetratricopeptide (TPR) repeat protein